ncbi:hypothetical protein [Actinoplanes sp. L3-i22]|uniref:hypothetical protein n=1 Tax=Actinoplanes sp. L3-i22 TaxID=2836373 RepID=UPI001C73E1C9|nr:hypothetical protein [Actinoplanes sp. L3-i22]BCY10264.1 hypothetical protein L3i22_053520 [Actinoplanes sp. L3-i22]
MSRLRFAGIAVAALALTGAAAWTVGAGQQKPVMSTPAAQLLASPAAPADRTDRTDRAGDRAPVPPSSPAATTASSSAKKPRVYGTPAPFVQTFAAQPGRTRIRPGKSPRTPVKVAPTVDGCDRNYGTTAQCVPLTYPKGTSDRCAWLKAHGFTGLKVVAKDPQKLDPDRNRIACG